jgi:hypothetical protein
MSRPEEMSIGAPIRGVLADRVVRVVHVWAGADALLLDHSVGHELREFAYERALVNEAMTSADVERIREDMERSEVRVLQSRLIRTFLLEAFALRCLVVPVCSIVQMIQVTA